MTCSPAPRGSSITRDLSTTEGSQYNGKQPAPPQKVQDIVRSDAAVDKSLPEEKMALPDAKLAADGAVS